MRRTHFIGMDWRELKQAKALAETLRREYTTQVRQSHRADYIEAALQHERWSWWRPLRDRWGQNADDAFGLLTPVEKISVGLLNPDNLLRSPLQSRYSSWMLFRKYPPLGDRLLDNANRLGRRIRDFPRRARVAIRRLYWQKVEPAKRSVSAMFWRAYYRLPGIV